MTEFDNLCEGFSRKITKTERYPKNIDLSPRLLKMLKREYKDNRLKCNGGKNFHSNILKALSFKLDGICKEVECEIKEEEAKEASES